MSLFDIAWAALVTAWVCVLAYIFTSKRRH
jgi:hypothetical protein